VRALSFTSVVPEAGVVVVKRISASRSAAAAAAAVASASESDKLKLQRNAIIRLSYAHSVCLSICYYTRRRSTMNATPRQSGASRLLLHARTHTHKH